jgi:tRNA pseudouridine55 synthase
MIEAGFLNLIKPPGMSSHDVVYRVRRRLPKGTKVGHLGTLDPAAAGVLPVAIGWATRLISHLPEGSKAYLAELQFGVRSLSWDAACPLEPGGPVPADLQALVEQQLPHYRGEIMQVPPSVSALQTDGKRAYDRVRAGEQFELPARAARYDEVRWVRRSQNLVTLRVACGPGTYVRALARDLGEAVGCGAVLRFLLRLQSGDFHLPKAVTLEEWQPEHVLPWHWPWREQPRREVAQWPPPSQGEDGLAFHPSGAVLYRQGVKVWSREGQLNGIST